MCELTCAFVSVCVCNRVYIWAAAVPNPLSVRRRSFKLALAHIHIPHAVCVCAQWLSNCITDVISMFICSCQSFDSLCNASMFVNLSTGVLVCVCVCMRVYVCTRNKKSAQSTYYTSVVIKGSDKMTYTHAHTEQTFTHTHRHTAATRPESCTCS